MDTSVLLPAKPWRRILNLGAFSLFLGLNYPIALRVRLAEAEIDPGRMMRSNCVYTLHPEVGLRFIVHPKVCRFTLDGEHAAVGLGIHHVCLERQTPLWFIPSLANALEWNQTKKENSMDEVD